MATIKTEDIIAYKVGKETVCPNCIEKAERDAVSSDDILTDHHDARVDAIIFFCDRCKKQI